MKNIIESLTLALEKKGSLIDNLNADSSLLWQEDYPVAVVHEKVRVKDMQVLALMNQKGLFDAQGVTPSLYSTELLSFYREKASAYLKTVSLMGMQTSNADSYTFSPKFTHDKWKKIQNLTGFQAVIERSRYEANTDTHNIEENLRDIMRSTKEIPEVKTVGFVWVATVPQSIDLSAIMQHYFLDNHTRLSIDNSHIYLGWSPTLKEVNMRYFVSKPR